MAEDTNAQDTGQPTGQKTPPDGATPTVAKRSRQRKSKTPGETADVAISQIDATTSVDAGLTEVEPLPSATPEAPALTLQDTISSDSTATVTHTAPASPPVRFGSGCGDALKSAREAQGLSIQEVCRQLRLSANQIQAIEQDDFEQLPQKTIVRGFIRNYARLLNIDAAPILQAYQSMVPQEAPLALTVKSNADESVFEAKSSTYARPSQLLKYLLWGLLLAILTYFYYHHIRPNTNKNAAVVLNAPASTEPMVVEVSPPVAAVESTAAVSPASETTTPNTDTPTTAGVTPSTTEPVATAPAAVVNNLPTNSAPTSTTVSNLPSGTTASTPVVTPPATAQTVVVSPTPADTRTNSEVKLVAIEPGKTTLKFKAQDESWIRVEDADGKKILSQILPPGGEQTLTASKPLTLIVGNASATQLLIDNQPYDLTQATRGRVARVQLK